MADTHSELLTILADGVVEVKTKYYRYWKCDAWTVGPAMGPPCNPADPHEDGDCHWSWRGPELTDQQVAMKLTYNQGAGPQVQGELDDARPG